MPDLPCPEALWPRFSTLLDEALDLPPPARTDWLDRLSGQDADLRPWLNEVLARAAADRTDSFMSSPATLPDAFAAGDVIGPYCLDALLGEGGMGQVWSATRLDDGPRRQVALKLLRPDLLGGTWRSRFGRERDVLAALTHPNIAQLYDAGVSKDGHPYLVLECVAGAPITTARAAPLEQRIGLLIQVLDALSYAHARLIVHRDIKPSNVLVTPEGQVKLLDFGIAKLLDAPETADLMLTQPMARLATPGYGAPEQMTGAPIGVAADVFSAGVLAFELLAGQRPFAAVPTSPDAAAAPLASRATQANAADPRLAARLRGDLDAILARALALAPRDRYISAEAFARDLRRWQAGQPVSARKIAWPVLAAKFARRNRLAVGLAATLLAAIIGGSAAVAWQAHRAALQAARAEQEAARAQHEAARATAISGFLVDLFKRGDPRGGGKPVGQMTALELLDAGAASADTAFKHDPETELSLLTTLANTYEELGDKAHSRALWQRRVALARALYGDADPRLFDTRIELAESLAAWLEYRDSLALLDSIKDQALHQVDPPRRARWLFSHGYALDGIPGARAEATRDITESIRLHALYAPAATQYGEALDMLASLQMDDGKNAESLATLQRVAAVAAAQGGFDPLRALAQDYNLAIRYQRLGDAAQAEAHYRAAQDAAEKLVGRDSHWYASTLADRAQLASLTGARDRAETLFQFGLSVTAKGAGGLGMGRYMQRGYAAHLLRCGQPGAALRIMQAVLPDARASSASESELRRSFGLLGDANDQSGNAAAARDQLRASRDAWMRYGAAASRPVLLARERWARYLLDHNDPAGASDEFSAVLHAAAGAKTEPAARAYGGLARIALTAHDLAQADANSAAALRTLAATTDEMDIRANPDLKMIRAEILAALGRKAEAAALAKTALSEATAYDAPTSPRVAQASALVAHLSP